MRGPGPATSLLAQNRAKSADSWASRAGSAVQAGSSRWMVIAARYMATCLAASCSQSATRVRQAIPRGQLRMLAGQTHEVNPGVLAPVLVEFFTS